MSHKDPNKKQEYWKEYYRKNRETILAKRRNADKEERERVLQYKREWYERNREHHIAKVKKRRKEEYGGRCVVCGAGTLGSSKNTPPPRYCKNHRSEQWDEKLALKKEEKVKEAAKRIPESRKKYVPKITQEKLAQSSFKGPAFSRLNKGEKEKDPSPREWGSP